tara:strand:+ start:162 stop:440 length:279 start_codon:yes stop_codon:yes gene_type:complete
MENSVKETVIEILAEKALLETKDVYDNSSLESLGIDSLALVEVIFSLEESFDITIPFNANDPGSTNFDISSVSSVVSAVESIIKSSTSKPQI